MAFAILLKHARHKIVNAMNGAPEVDTQHPLPIGQAALPDSCTATNASIVEEKMHPTIGIEGSPGQRLDICSPRNIGLHRQDIRAAGLQFRLGLLESGLLH